MQLVKHFGVCEDAKNGCWAVDGFYGIGSFTITGMVNMFVFWCVDLFGRGGVGVRCWFRVLIM